ncbi:MAG: nucleotidyl transferase AbiEii/AbiGii toxin family protein [Firmicutes bacterium]|nr:nucleotidyl transferase AbiEii/AbiGii toxin family protein [Candidatus Colivicinus equi]
MMNLHKNKDDYYEIIKRIMEDKNIMDKFIEKDYYVTMILEEFHNLEPDIVFKGGTSLSKAYHLINRFSEDIDINYIDHSKLKNKKRKDIKYNLKFAVEKCGFSISNLESTRSKRFFNRYIIPYESVFDSDTNIRCEVVVETAYQEQSYPVEKVKIRSMIAEYLIENGRQDIIDEYGLDGFEMYVQKYERTLIDKLFALVDYYLSGRIKEHSRHLYDIHMIYPLVDFNDEFNRLFNEVKLERSKSEICLSAKEDANLVDLLNDIISKDIYKDDYESITSNLILDGTSYEECIKTLKEIINIIRVI